MLYFTEKNVDNIIAQFLMNPENFKIEDLLNDFVLTLFASVAFEEKMWMCLSWV